MRDLNFASLVLVGAGVVGLTVGILGVASVFTFGILPIVTMTMLGVAFLVSAATFKYIDYSNHTNTNDTAVFYNPDASIDPIFSSLAGNYFSPSFENVLHHTHVQPSQRYSEGTRHLNEPVPSSPSPYPVSPPPYSSEAPLLVVPMRSGEINMQVRPPQSKLYSFFSSFLFFKPSSPKGLPSYEEIFSDSPKQKLFS